MSRAAVSTRRRTTPRSPRADGAHHPGRRRARRPRSAAASVRAARRPRATAAPAPPGRARRPAGGPPRPPRSPSCRRRHRRWPAATPARRPARTTTRRAPGRPARPTSCAACGATAGRRAEIGRLDRPRQPAPSCGGPGPAGEAGAPRSRLAHHPRAVGGRHGDERVGRGRVVGEAALTERRRRRRPAARRGLRSRLAVLGAPHPLAKSCRSPARRNRRRRGGERDRLGDRLPSRAAAEVGMSSAVPGGALSTGRLLPPEMR